MGKLKGQLVAKWLFTPQPLYRLRESASPLFFCAFEVECICCKPMNRTGLLAKRRAALMDLQSAELTHGQLVVGGWRGGRERSKVCLVTFTRPYWEITYHDCSYIDLGCLAESSHGVHVVVEDDDPHHDPHAEHQCFFTGKPTPVFPGRDGKWQRCYFHDRVCLFLAPQLASLASCNPLLRTMLDLQEPG